MDFNATASASPIVPDWLSRRRHSGRLAIECEGVAWTYAELHERAGRLAGELAKSGVRSGERVALLARHGLVFAATVHALIQLGAVLVPLNTRLAIPELVWQVNAGRVRLLVCDAEHSHLAQQLMDQMSTDGKSSVTAVLTLDGEHWPASADPVLRDHLDLRDVQCVMFTSGTTGRPKGALITYGNHLWGATGSAFRLGVHPDDKWLTPLPLFHVGGQAVLLRSVIYGTAAVIHRAFDPDAVNHAIDTQGVSLVSVVPAMLARMIANREAPYPGTLRNILLGGGPAPRPLLEDCRSLAVPVSQSYGLTEANSQVATLAVEDSMRKLGSSGQPLLMTEVRIMDGEVALPPWSEGEIALRGPTVIPGYDSQSEASADAFRDGWFYTGDMGYLDDEGYLFVLDRRSDLIVSGGENVYPAEVEAVLLAHPDVVEAGVTGVADERFGQAVLAVVALRAGALVEDADIRLFCRERLGGYKVPRDIRFAAGLPRNAAGKLLRKELVKCL